MPKSKGSLKEKQYWLNLLPSKSIKNFLKITISHFQIAYEWPAKNHLKQVLYSEDQTISIFKTEYIIYWCFPNFFFLFYKRIKYWPSVLFQKGKIFCHYKNVVEQLVCCRVIVGFQKKKYNPNTSETLIFLYLVCWTNEHDQEFIKFNWE